MKGSFSDHSPYCKPLKKEDVAACFDRVCESSAIDPEIYEAMDIIKKQADRVLVDLPCVVPSKGWLSYKVYMPLQAVAGEINEKTDISEKKLRQFKRQVCGEVSLVFYRFD